MKTIGIIGGLGPETSATFYLELIKKCFAKNKTQRPPILLWNIPIEYKVENRLILKGKGEEKYLPLLLDAARRLEKGGADFLVIPCNTVHIFIEEIRKAVKIPVLSIVEETVRIIKQRQIKKVGFLATELTIKKRVYDDIFEKNNIESILSTPSEQNEINNIIHAILGRSNSKKEKVQLGRIIRSLRKKGAEAIILACTDLQHLISKDSPQIIDTMSTLAQSSTHEILRRNTT